MKDTLKPGLKFEFDFKVPESKTVPYIYPESEEFRIMPKVFSTGFMVGLIEWACVRFVNEHIDWPREQSVGIDIRLNHLAATPPGLTVKVNGELTGVEGRKLSFAVSAHDGVDLITEGTHERFVVNAEKFTAKAEEKARQAGV
ncbi:MAG: thioesterase family protein [Candidatus Dadabacteria bacterium]|nr:thioesterase family protein [Candidatus Dadabacteria bacterium]